MDLNHLAKKYSIECQEPSSPPDLKPVEDSSVDMAEIGVVGTRFYTGDIAIEPSNSYRPRYVRGKTGNPRLYEEYYRGEPLILDAVQSYTELLVAGTYDLPVPETPEDQREAVQAFCDFYKSKLFNLRGGWLNYIEHAASKLIFGFSIFEIVWDEDEDGRKYPVKLAFREQNTVEDWIMGERGDELVAVRFNTGGNHPMYYTLPAHKVLVANLNARGNNFEGIPPIRPAIHWIKMKRILAQIAAISAEKYGVPITQVRADPAYNEMFPGGMDDDRKEDVRTIYASMRAAEAPVIEMPDGLMAESVAPPGTMPDLLNLIQYCDQMITAAFSNEGALLGMQSQVGSYALGEQKERDFLRSAPYYARKALAPINQMLHKLAREWFGDDMPPICPKMVYRVDGLKDASRWLDDVNKLFPNTAWRQDKELTKAVFKELGVEAPVEEETEQASKAAAGDAPQTGVGQKVADTALNGAQVTSMVTVVQQVAQGLLPADSAQRILQKAFLLSPEEAAAIVNPASGTAAAQDAKAAAQEAEDEGGDE